MERLLRLGDVDVAERQAVFRAEFLRQVVVAVDEERFAMDRHRLVGNDDLAALSAAAPALPRTPRRVRAARIIPRS